MSDPTGSSIRPSADTWTARRRAEHCDHCGRRIADAGQEARRWRDLCLACSRSELGPIHGVRVGGRVESPLELEMPARSEPQPRHTVPLITWSALLDGVSVASVDSQTIATVAVHGVKREMDPYKVTWRVVDGPYGHRQLKPKKSVAVAVARAQRKCEAEYLLHRAREALTESNRVAVAEHARVAFTERARALLAQPISPRADVIHILASAAITLQRAVPGMPRQRVYDPKPR